MTPEEMAARGERAKYLMDDDLLKEALATIEREVIEAYVVCPTRDLEGMRVLQTNLRIVRQFKGILLGVMQQGRLAVSDIQQKQSVIQDVKNRFAHHAQKWGM